jgi:hypothetical protein
MADYVATTKGETNPGLDDWDQRKYVNAVTIPYAVWAPDWAARNVALGDFGLAIPRPLYSGKPSGFVFADQGRSRVVGEVSRKLLETLTPRRDTDERYLFLVFPRSGIRVGNSLKFTSESTVQSQVKAILDNLEKIDAYELIAIFLAFGADRQRFLNYRSGALKLSESAAIETDIRYTRILSALQGSTW